MPHTIKENGAIYYRTENPYEKNYGFSRAVRKGPFIFIGGTTSFDPETGDLLHADSAYRQAKVIFETIIKAVESLGGKKTDIMKVKMFATNMESALEVGNAFKEYFEDIHPAAILVLGIELASPDLKIEVEAEALVL